MKNTVPQNVIKSCPYGVFYSDSEAFFSSRYSCNTCLYFRWLFWVLGIVIFYEYFSFSLDKSRKSSHCLSFTECELCDRADQITKYPELSVARGIELETSMYNKCLLLYTEVSISIPRAADYSEYFVMRSARSNSSRSLNDKQWLDLLD